MRLGREKEMERAMGMGRGMEIGREMGMERKLRMEREMAMGIKVGIGREMKMEGLGGRWGWEVDRDREEDLYWMYHRERILETSTLSCNEEKEEVTKPPTR